MYKKPALYGENVYFFLFKYVQLFKHEQKLSFVFQNVQLNNLIFFWLHSLFACETAAR